MGELRAQINQLGAQMSELRMERRGQSGAKTVQMGQLGPQMIKTGPKHGKWKMASRSILVSKRPIEDSNGLKQALFNVRMAFPNFSLELAHLVHDLA